MAMSMATGAMGSLLPKLIELLKDEYKLKESVKEGVRSLEQEMKSMQAALRKVGEVPRDQLDEQVKIWAGEVRELSFNMEDVIDKFLVRVDDGSEPAANPKKLKRLTKKMVGLFTKGKARHEIADAIKSINKKVQEVADRRARYNVDNIVAKVTTVTPIDPRLGALYKEVTDLVGITGTRDQDIMKLLSDGDDMFEKKLKIVSVVGFGGLGKTTLVKTVYDKIEGNYDCRAFVPVGRKAEARKVFIDILLNLGLKGSQLIMLDEKLLIDKLREFLKNKRYLIVIDDIWDEELWIVIKCAFSGSNNFGSRLITTTRIVSVSESCCSSTDDSVYQMEPLSDEDSKRLFCKRLFSSESGCPPEFEVVSRDILKKCGGVPLAIITIASLLASGQQVKPKNEWHVLLDSIGRGLTENRSVKEMLRILSFSYYDLPSHLKTCLLYLSMFPEDREIEKNQLIWMWIAEGFVHCGEAKTSLFEMGETYFNELVNRSLIQPVYDDIEGFVSGCRVHDSVLDLICSLSREENFVTIMNWTSDSMPFHSNIRRLSLQRARKEKDETMPLGSEGMKKLRSVVTFEHAAELLPPFSSFAVLRVLDLGGYDGYEEGNLKFRELGNLLHLRYLRLSQFYLHELPEEIGKLQFLQVLDLPGGIILPSTLIKLTRLMCLRIHGGSSLLPDGIGNLTSMEVMDEIKVGSVSLVKELCNMDKMRELSISFKSLGLVEAFVESLRKMQRIQRLLLNFEFESEVPTDLLEESWVPPATIQKFIMNRGVILYKLPAWNPYHLSQLSRLQIFVEEVGQEDLAFLGRLPALRYLGLVIRRQTPLLISAEEFCCLETLYLISNSPTQILFQPGALTKAKEVMFCIRLPLAKEEAAGNGGDWLEVGMGNLPSLCNVIVRVGYCGLTVGEARQAKAALKNVLRAHPNSPTFKIYSVPNIPKGANDDDVCIEDGVLDGYGSDYSIEDVCSEDANDDDVCSEDGV